MNSLYDNYTSTAVDVENYQESADWTTNYVSTHVVQHLPDDKESKILEIGCGWGKYVYSLGQLGYSHVHGIDISPEQIETGKRELGLDNIAVEDAHKILKKKKQYDSIILMDVLEHFATDDLIELGTEVYNNLNDGGVLIAQVPNGISLMQPIRYADFTHMRAFSVYSAQQYLKLCGFTDITVVELPPLKHTLKSTIRHYLWKLVIRPIIMAYMFIANGSLMGNVYTSNLMMIARK